MPCDVAFADRFDELFGGTDIGAAPTGKHGGRLAEDGSPHHAVMRDAQYTEQGD